MRIVVYTRASFWGDRAPREHLAEQRQAVEAAARTRRWTVVGVEEDRLAARTLRRPALQRALDACRAGRADGIVVAELSRLTREPQDLAALAADALEHGYTLVALAEDLDLRRPNGNRLVEALAAMAGWSRRSLVRERATGPTERRRGRPSSTPPAVAERIRALRRGGMTLQAICDVLNADGVPTPRDGRLWRPTSLRAVLKEA